MLKNALKQVFLFLGLLWPIAWCGATNFINTDGYSAIQIKEAQVQSAPKNSSIHATIDGHTLTVVFTENLGQVTIEVTTAMGTSVHYTQTPTPNGFQIYILNTGNYIITFTLPNGDEYYGEFTVTD